MEETFDQCDIYSYKVIYPGGTFVRVSPAVNAAKTGDILEFGAVFEATKSLYLDGINYVKLASGKGWVFGSKGDIKVLDLIEVSHRPEVVQFAVRSETSSVDCVPKSQSGKSRSQNLYWREVRARVRSCTTFDHFSKLVCDGTSERPPSTPEPGPARSAWMSESLSDVQVRRCISLIASTTQKGAQGLAEMGDLEAHLWVLAHMGAQVPHVMQLAVAEANWRFEQLAVVQRGELLTCALEVGAATRAHNAELARHIDVLPDDLRNFIQRWVIIKVSRVMYRLSLPMWLTSRTANFAGVPFRTLVARQPAATPSEWLRVSCSRRHAA